MGLGTALKLFTLFAQSLLFMLFVLIAVVAAAAAGGVSWLVCKSRFAAKLAVAEAQQHSLHDTHEKVSRQLAESQQALSGAQQQTARLQAVVAAKDEQLAEQKAFVEK